MIPDEKLEQYRETLVATLERLNRTGDSESGPVRLADFHELAAVNHARYVEDRQGEIQHSVRDAVQLALERLEDGEYGICVECGEQIGLKRLAAVPWADRCVECQSQREASESWAKAA